ncbi:MAG: hypothetical protein GKR89_28490 [Candidatus Latescibacteria bacterium]|nr:hypothetical protein [Candidatus Latescibacterota bacterium]
MIGIALIGLSVQTFSAESDLIGTWRRPGTDIVLIFEDRSFFMGDEAISAGWRCSWTASDSIVFTDCLPGILTALDLDTEHIIEEGQEFVYAIEGQILRITNSDGDEVSYRRDSETAVRDESWGRIKARY